MGGGRESGIDSETMWGDASGSSRQKRTWATAAAATNPSQAKASPPQKKLKQQTEQEKELQWVFKEKNKLDVENQKLKDKIDALQKKLQKSESDQKTMGEQMIVHKQQRQAAEKMVEDIIGGSEHMSKVGSIKRNKAGEIKFVELFQREKLCDKWYIYNHRQGEFTKSVFSGGLKEFQGCGRLQQNGFCPYAHSFEEQEIEQHLSGGWWGKKTTPCSRHENASVKSAQSENGQVKSCCPFLPQHCFRWHGQD
eukprot:SAG11_NODE_4496_length_1874_cov_118.907606_1_plen_251_part_10